MKDHQIIIAAEIDPPPGRSQLHGIAEEFGPALLLTFFILLPAVPDHVMGELIGFVCSRRKDLPRHPQAVPGDTGEIVAQRQELVLKVGAVMRRAVKGVGRGRAIIEAARPGRGRHLILNKLDTKGKDAHQGVGPAHGGKSARAIDPGGGMTGGGAGEKGSAKAQEEKQSDQRTSLHGATWKKRESAGYNSAKGKSFDKLLPLRGLTTGLARNRCSGRNAWCWPADAPHRQRHS